MDLKKVYFHWFQSTYLYKVRLMPMMFPIQTKMFQSTYLYKVRPERDLFWGLQSRFQSTYLYKVRHRDDLKLTGGAIVSIHVPI